MSAIGTVPLSSVHRVSLPAIPCHGRLVSMRSCWACSQRFRPRRDVFLLPGRTRPDPSSFSDVFLRYGRIGNSDMTSQLDLGKPDDKPVSGKHVHGVFWVLLVNLVIYVLDHWFQLVEEEEGSFALWASYLLTGAGANLVSWFVLPRSAVSIGASGAVFGLFAIGVLVKLDWNWRKILEVLILGQFVIKKVMEEAQASAGFAGTFGGGYALQNINHIAHLSGALIGVMLIWLLSRIPVRPSK